MGNRIRNLQAEEKRSRERPKIRCVENDLRKKGLTERDVQDRGSWRRLLGKATPNGKSYRGRRKRRVVPNVYLGSL